MRIVAALIDDRAVCESLRAALPETDLLVVESTAAAMKRRLVSDKPDVLIVDDTPALTVDELVSITRDSRHVPVLVLSNRIDTESQAAFIVAGAKQTIAKPFDCDDLLQAIDAVVEKPVATHPAPVASAVVHPMAAPAPVHQHQSALRWMSRNAAQLDDPNQLARSVVEALVDIFDTARAAVLLVRNGSARVAASHGVAESLVETMRLPFAEGLMGWLDENGCLFDRRRHPEAYDAQKEMGVLRARLAFPIVVDGQMRGAVLLGEKASGGDYSDEERELLSVMTRSLATSFQRARQYRDVSRQQHRLDAVLSSITTGVITVRPDKTVSMMNESAERILGISAVNVLGKSVQRLGSVFADIVLQTIADGAPRLRQQIHLPKPEVTLGLSVTPVGEEGVAAIFAPIPPEEAVKKSAGDTPFWEFLSSRVAQEIKNPMVAINTFAQLLPTKYDSRGFREEFAKVVQGEVGRINAVVEALYAFARRPEVRAETRDLNSEVEAALNSFEAELAEKSIKIKKSFEKADVSVNVDSKLFEQAIKNVVRNSIDAMRDGGTLTVSTKRNNGWCELVVADSGPGVTDQDAPLIFLPFYSTKEQGMGLGLTMAERIVDEHHGHLEMMKPPTGGSAFAFRMPPATN